MLIEKGGDGGSFGAFAPGRETACSFETRARDLCCIFATLLYLVCFDLLHLVPGHKKRATFSSPSFVATRRNSIELSLIF